MPDSAYPALFDRLEKDGDPSRPFLFGAVSMTYGELFDRVRRIAALLLARGTSPGDRVIVATRDDKEVAALFLAMLRCGVTAVVLDPEASPSMLANLLGASRPVGAFIDAAVVARMGRSTITARGWLIEIESGGAPLLKRLLLKKAASKDKYPAILETVEPARELPQRIDEAAVGYLLFTSGTTSRPKGVELTHANLAAHMKTLVGQYGFGAGTRLLNHVPLHHTDGISHGVLVTLSAGGALFRSKRFTIHGLADFLEDVYVHRITHMYTVPAVLALILRLGKESRDSFLTKDFRFVISGAGFLDETLWRGFEAEFRTRVVNVYGLTESVSQSLYCGPDDATRRVGTLGKPVDCEIRVSEEGELLLKGKHIMKGYFDDPQATAEVLRDGWLHTGDLVRVEDGGFVRFLGRKRSVIVRGGINVYPEDVTCVLRAIPGVADAVTLGWEDEVWEERVVACVEPIPGAVLTVETLREACSKTLSPEMFPDEFFLIGAFPRGPAGKTALPKLKERIAELRSGKTTGAKGGRAAVIRALAAQCFALSPDSLREDSTPDNTDGWDSMAHMAFVTALESEFSIRLEARDIMALVSLSSAERIVRERLSEK